MAIGSFNNPITGATGALVRPSVHSPNYIPDETGWTINKDGTAEFADLTVRGTIVVESTNDGVFVYAYFPAAA